MRAADIAAGAVLAVLGLVMLFGIIPTEIGSTVDQGVAPDVFPRALMWLVTLLAALLVASRLAVRGAQHEAAPLRAENVVYIAAGSLALAGAFFAIRYLGFVVGGALTVAVAMLAMDGRRHPVRLVLTTVIAPVAVYLVFRYLFAVYLP